MTKHIHIKRENGRTTAAVSRETIENTTILFDGVPLGPPSEVIVTRKLDPADFGKHNVVPSLVRFAIEPTDGEREE